MAQNSLTQPDTEVYSPGQLKHVYAPMIDAGLPDPDWLLLGGPACANEAQTAVARWPGINVIGVDPNPGVIDWQLAHGWPEGQPLVRAALWDSVGSVPMWNAGTDLLHASVYHPTGPDDPAAVIMPGCPATTWDELDACYGPFGNAVLWMDIEGSELEALRGAAGLFARGAIQAVNVELLHRESEPHQWYRDDAIDALLKNHGFVPVKDWNDSEFCRDRVYVRHPGGS